MREVDYGARRAIVDDEITMEMWRVEDEKVCEAIDWGGGGGNRTK